MVSSVQGNGVGFSAALEDLAYEADIETGAIGRLGDVDQSTTTSRQNVDGVKQAWASQKGAWVHQRATYLVIGRHLSREENRALAYSHFAADAPEFQGPASTHRHAMRREKQPIHEARQDANEFVREQFSKAWNAKTRHEALTEFGLALHALQDSTSPAHAGFQEWPDHPSYLEWGNHIGHEVINPGEGSELFRATQQAWDWFNEGALPEGDLFIFGCDGCTA